MKNLINRVVEVEESNLSIGYPMVLASHVLFHLHFLFVFLSQILISNTLPDYPEKEYKLLENECNEYEDIKSIISLIQEPIIKNNLKEQLRKWRNYVDIEER